MKKIIALALCSIIIYGCAKKTNPVPTPSPSNPTGQPVPKPTNARFIPNWQRDTLIGSCVDVNGQTVGYDTIISYSVNDTSLIQHQGKKYYIWWSPMSSADTFKNNYMLYVNCQISTTNDTTGILNEYLTTAFPHKYMDDFYKTWATQKQILKGYNFHPTLKVWNSTYVSLK